MRSIRSLLTIASLCCCIAAGCAARGPQDDAIHPTSPMPVQPGKAPVATVQQLGEALARQVEQADPQQPITSQHVYKMATLAAQRAGVTVDLGPVPDNRELSAGERGEWSAKFRSLR